MMLPWMLALLATSALMSSSETACFSLTRSDQRRLAARSRAVASLLARPGSLLVTLLAANLLVNIGYFSLSAAWSMSLAAEERVLASSLVAAGSVAALVLFGEILPKTLALAAPAPLVTLTAPALVLLRMLMRPLTVPGEILSRIVVHALRRGSAPAGGPVGQDLKSALTLRAALGGYHEVELALLHDVVDFGERRAREIMVPRVSIVHLDIKASRQAWIARMAAHPFEEYPVCDGSPDRLLGTVRAGRVLAEPHTPRQELLEPALLVPLSIDADRLVQVLQASDRRLAFLLDEHGGLAGLVGWGAVSQAVLGELEAAPRADALIRRRGPDALLVAGHCSLRQLAEEGGVSLPARRAGTVSGAITEALGRAPRSGDSLGVGNFRIRVLRLRGRRVELVLIRPARAGT